MNRKHVGIAGVLFVLSLIAIIFSQGLFVKGEEVKAKVDEHLIALQETSPEEKVIMVLALDTDNEGLIELIEKETREINEEIEKIGLEFKNRFSELKDELGYDENEEEILALYREGDEEFKELYEKLEIKYHLTKEERLDPMKRVDELRDERNKIIYGILSSKYSPIQNKVIGMLKRIPETSIIFQDLATNKISIQTPAKNTEAISKIKGVHEMIYGEYEFTDELFYSVPTIGAPTWNNNGYNGYPFDLLHLNGGGIFTAHPNLDHVNWISECFASGPCDPINPTNGHDTMVAGVMISDHPQWRGVSINPDKYYNGRVETFPRVQEAVTWAVINASDNAEFITMSMMFANAPPYCGDRVDEEYVDEIVDLFDINWIDSAGNEGENQNQNVTAPSGTYNIIAAGASFDKNTVSRDDDEIWSGSSRGPVDICNSDEKRIKPDIVAPGAGITSTTLGGGFSTGTGTSSAAPHVAGSLLLIQDYGILYSALEMKALLYNTAEDRLESNGAAGNDGPDNTWGYGYLDMDRAWFEADYVIKKPVGAVGPLYFRSSPANANDKSTIVWNRHIVNNDGVTNNLDLFLYDESNNNLIDESTFIGRNIEQVVYDADYTSSILKVKMEDLNTGSLEFFGLAMNNQFSQVVPPSFSAGVTVAPSTVPCGGAPINVVVPITNTGGIILHDVTARINSGMPPTNGDNPQNLGTIVPGSAENATWELLPSAPGEEELDFEIWSNSYGETFRKTCKVEVPVCLNSASFTGVAVCV